jgi:hypothetical protein
MEKGGFTINNAETGDTYMQKWTKYCTVHHVQKLTQNEL